MDSSPTILQKLILEEILNTVRNTHSRSGTQWQKKLHHLIAATYQREHLEAIGKELSPLQFLSLLDTTLQIEDKHHWKMAPILVGMKSPQFIKVLDRMNDSQLHIFQYEGITEAVQHHLTTLTHRLANQIEVLATEINRLFYDLEILDVQSVSRENAKKIYQIIVDLEGKIQHHFQTASKGISIAWNSNRQDLIEGLSAIKDGCQKTLRYGIGEPRDRAQEPTGLYKQFENTFFACYGDDPTKNFEALNDSEPATEGLTKLSVWYLQDYFELGLLPNISNLSELNTQNEKERVKYRETLINQVNQSLKKVGLVTVGDLKKALIFSNASLKSYLQNYTKSVM